MNTIPTETMYSDGYHLSFASTARDSGSDTDFVITHKLPPGIQGKEPNRVAVVDMAFPKSWYLISFPYNTFVLTELGISRTITVTPGNYSITQWCAQIPLLLNAASTAMGHNWTYTAARILVPENGLIQYSVTNNGGNQPVFTIAAITETKFDGDGNMSQQLGLPAGTSTFSGNSLLGSIVYNGVGEFGARLLSTVCEPDGSDSIADIYDVGLSLFGSVIRFQAQDALLQSKRFVHRNGSSFHYQLVSSSTGRPINTNGLPLAIHLRFWYQPESELDVLKAILAKFLEYEPLLRSMDQHLASIKGNVAEYKDAGNDLSKVPASALSTVDSDSSGTDKVDDEFDSNHDIPDDFVDVNASDTGETNL